MSISERARTLVLALLFPMALMLTTLPATAQEEEQPPEDQPQTEEQTDMTGAANLLETAQNQTQLSLFVRAVEQSGLAEELRSKGPYTIFAPTDEAFRSHFSEEEINTLLGEGAGQQGMGQDQPQDEQPAGGEEQPQDQPMGEEQPQDQPQGEEYGQANVGGDQQSRDKLLEVIRAHIVTGEWPADRLQSFDAVRNVLGQRIAISSGGDEGMQMGEGEQPAGEEQPGQPGEEQPAEGEYPQEGQEGGQQYPQEGGQAQTQTGTTTDLKVGDANIVQADIRASNGIIHQVDAVIKAEEETQADEQWQQDQQDQPQGEEQMPEGEYPQEDTAQSSPEGR